MLAPRLLWCKVVKDNKWRRAMNSDKRDFDNVRTTEYSVDTERFACGAARQLPVAISLAQS